MWPNLAPTHSIWLWLLQIVTCGSLGSCTLRWTSHEGVDFRVGSFRREANTAVHFYWTARVIGRLHLVWIPCVWVGHCTSDMVAISVIAEHRSDTQGDLPAPTLLYTHRPAPHTAFGVKMCGCNNLNDCKVFRWNSLFFN